MAIATWTDKAELRARIEAALGEGASGADVVELVIRSGWQPRPLPDPDAEHLEGVLADGTRVPVQIIHARRAG